MKFFYIFSLLFLFFLPNFVNAELKIISRNEWWADENIRFIDSPEWQEIFKKRQKQIEESKNNVLTEEQKEAEKKAKKRAELINKILLTNFQSQFEISSNIDSENWRKLLWKIQKAKKIHWIVIHHTWSDYESSLKWIKNIYKYHTLTREWWDIWYNYLIWNDWEIYEWRAWWDYVVAAHNKYNNIWTVWIAIIWDYSEKPISDKQYNSLKELTKYLVNKYDIDLKQKTYFHEECLWSWCDLPITSTLKEPIIWHRDAWNTSCPWDELYKQIDLLKLDLIEELNTNLSSSQKKIYSFFDKYAEWELLDILAKIENLLEVKYDTKRLKLKTLILDYFKYKNTIKNVSKNNIDNEKINIKLSYPDNNIITIKNNWKIYNIKRNWNKIELNWKEYNVYKISNNNDLNSIIEITSWDRVPKWDKNKKYNDNKFRWELIIYVKNNELIVVNRLNIEDYLKWLWEISDSETPEKIKTIIIAARSYAKWYIKNARKFPWEFYDGSDDPNEFQKYLWYSLEQRSANINRIVDDTRWQVITYNWELIKPWYFSNSDWRTLSYYEYCILKYSDEICIKESSKYPYLQSVEDIWSKWKLRYWHWVWISWAWVKYFSLKWWTYDMIIKYYLRWVEIG